ncbi:MAG: 4-hydroxy-tetrahydrodipicolinate synthase [Muribaculaceae bacterium]|nr:4-hydroxy-tetrahydrodipicolinate synthase [Muribaculaceae bacterium]
MRRNKGSFKFTGLGVALVTPFKRDFSIDYDSLKKVINFVIEGGCDYIVALGTTAETPTLTREEKDEITSFIRKETGGRIPLVLGIGGNNTQRVIRNIEQRDLEGYSAILSVTPYYNKPTQEGLFQHFKAISESSPLPIILYNVPGRTGVNMTSNTTLRLALSSPKFIGIKEASGKLDQSQEIIKGAPAGFSLISGNDSDTAAIMAMGGSGVISVLGNVLPSNMKKLVELCRNLKFDEATELQMRLNPLIKYLFEDGNPAGVKCLLSKSGLVENFLRLPLVGVSDTIKEKLEKEFLKFD